MPAVTSTIDEIALVERSTLQLPSRKTPGIDISTVRNTGEFPCLPVATPGLEQCGHFHRQTQTHQYEVDLQTVRLGSTKNKPIATPICANKNWGEEKNLSCNAQRSFSVCSKSQILKRVSTQKQGADGLGIAALNSSFSSIVLKEVESRQRTP